MKLAKIFSVILILSISYISASAYSEVECSTDATFSANSCNQCFDWWSKEVWSNIGFLSDVWVNTTNNDVLLYKEEQEMPSMVNLWWDATSWSQSPSSTDFWEYSDEFEELYTDEQEWYVLSSGWKTTRIKSKLGFSYSLDTNTANEWENIWLLVFPIVTHKVLSDWEIVIDSTEHKECVLYKSGEETEEVVVPPKKLPDTWPTEYILLLILAFLLWFGFIKMKSRA